MAQSLTLWQQIITANNCYSNSGRTDTSVKYKNKNVVHVQVTIYRRPIRNIRAIYIVGFTLTVVNDFYSQPYFMKFYTRYFLFIIKF